MGSSPTVPTVFGASSNGRTRVFGALNLGSNPSAPSIYSGIAQLVEQVAVNHRVVGSSPTAGANMSPVLDESVTNGRWAWFDSKW